MVEPLITLLGRTRNSVRKRWCMIVNIKPLGLPVTDLTARSIRNISPRHIRMKLKIGTPTVATFLKFGHGFRKNRLLKRSKWG